MFSKQKVQEIYKRFCSNESGNVLLFSVVVLLFLVFVVSVLSLSVVNRVRVVRRENDNSQVTAVAKQYNQSVQNSIQQVINESDELARYYVGQRYYQRDDTSFNQGSSSRNSGKNADLDRYLSALIRPDFQTDIKIQMSKTSPITNADCAKVVFAYLMIRRTPDSIANDDALHPLPTELKGIQGLISENLNGKATLQQITINMYGGISATSPSFSEIWGVVKNNKSFMDIKCKLHLDTKRLSSDILNEMNSNLEYQVNAFPYASSGSDVVQPGVDELKTTLISQKYQIHTVVNPDI